MPDAAHAIVNIAYKPLTKFPTGTSPRSDGERMTTVAVAPQMVNVRASTCKGANSGRDRALLRLLICTES